MRGLVVLLWLSVVAAPIGSAETVGGPEQELVKLENDWSQAVVKRDAAALQRFYADEYVFTDADGVVSTKAKEMANLTTGAFHLMSFKFDEMKVRVYGEVGVVTGRNTVKGTWDDNKRSISGPYRFTDVFVKRSGQWRCVASQSSRIAVQ